MFPRVSTASLYAVSALACLAAATPNPVKRWDVSTTTVTVTAPAPTVTTISQCNTGDMQCCQSVQSASSSPVSTLLGLLGIVLSDLDVLVGLTCSPISVIGVGSGTECSAHPVCCSNNSYGSLISIGCLPITL